MMTPIEGIWVDPERPGEALIITATQEGQVQAVLCTFDGDKNPLVLYGERGAWMDYNEAHWPLTRFEKITCDEDPAGYQTKASDAGGMRLQMSNDGMRVSLQPDTPTYEYPYTKRDFLLPTNTMA